MLYPFIYSKPLLIIFAVVVVISIYFSFTVILYKETQYAKWMAAFRMASKGKTMADVTYNSEKAGIQAFLSMQHDKGESTPTSPGQVLILPLWHFLVIEGFYHASF